MKKHLLMLAAALLLVTGVQARVITPTENQVWWGYFNEADFTTADYTIGTGTAMTLMAAIYVPAGHEQLANASVVAGRVYLASNVVSTLSSMKIWISKTLPEKVSDADVVLSTLGTLTAGANDFKLRTPYEVGGEGFYIGYSVKSTTGYFIRCGGTDAPNAFFVGNPEVGMAWTDLNGNGLGKLAFQILVEGGNFQDDCVSVDDFGQHVVLQGQDTSVPVTVTNMGKSSVETISYTIATEGGSTTEEKTLSVGPLAMGGFKTLSIPFTSDTDAKKLQKTFTVTQVNGKPNTATKGSGQGFLITLKDKQPVTPVIEEFTGTWCGWCPRGMVGMEKVHEAYGDQVVQIAAHSGDIMAINEYQPVVNTYTSGFPNSITDRQFEADPSFSTLQGALNKSFARVAPGSIELNAEWSSAAKTSVVFNTTTRFSYDDNDGQYGIACILVEDGLTGTGSNWAQQNYYNGQSVGGDMAWWCKAGSPVSGITFDHVVVASWEPMAGINGSVDPKIVAGEEQEYSYTASISGKSLIQDKTKLTAVVLLIDRTNGTIVNAAKSAIADFGTAIGNVHDAGQGAPGDVYDLSGRKLTISQKGINIIRTNDGTVKKVLVK